MRQIYSAALLTSLFAILLSCKKETVEIETLGKAGTEFYFGEKVPVWAGTRGDLDNMNYEWTATGGAFDGWRTQNLFENLWIAPDKVGEYTITAKAKNGRSSSSRSTTMKVTRYFFDEFQSEFTFEGNGWAQSNATTALVTDSDADKARVELSASGTSDANVRRSLNLATLKIPLSISTKLGWKDFFKAGKAMIVSLSFMQPATNPNYPYIREIRLEIWPTADANTDNYQLRYETFIPANASSSKFSANENTTATLPAPLPLINPVNGTMPGLTMASNVDKKISFSIDAANVFHIYVDGVLWFTSNGIKDWLAYAKTTYPGFQDPVAKEFKVTFPGKANNNEKGSTVYLNNVYINSDGQILK